MSVVANTQAVAKVMRRNHFVPRVPPNAGTVKSNNRSAIFRMLKYADQCPGKSVPIAKLIILAGFLLRPEAGSGAALFASLTARRAGRRRPAGRASRPYRKFHRRILHPVIRLVGQ